MSVDRGGLNYPVNVSYDSTPIDTFRSDIAAAKADWAKFKSALGQSSGTPSLPSIPTAPSGGGSGGGSAGGGAASGGGMFGGLSGLFGGGKGPPPVPAATNSSWSSFFKTLTGGSNDANKSVNFLINTFERLFLRVVIIGAIRKVGSEFASFVTEMLAFNATVETTTLGVTSLLLALGNMKDATGADTNNIRAFSLAHAEASKQIAQLRIDALKTSSTFEDLVKNYQGAIAPGLQAGLNLDEIRKFTVQISQAASAAGMPQNQLGEEIKSLLGGTINARNTKIATSLGISNDDIKQAKELGTLVQFLNEKFSAFSTAGDAALGTFNVILTNLKDGVQQIIGAGGVDFFKQIENIMKRIQDSLVTINKEKGILEPNPKAVFIIQQIADGLSYAVEQAVALTQEFGFEGVLASVQAFMGFLRLAFDILLGGFQGVVAAFKDLGGLLSIIGALIKDVFGVDIAKSMNVQQWVAYFVEGKLLLFVIGGLAGTLVNSFSSILGIMTAIGGQGLILMALMYVIAEGTRMFASYMSGTEVSFRALGEIIANNIVGALLTVWEYATNAFDNIWSTVKIGAYGVSDFVQTAFAKLFNFLEKALYGIIMGVLDGVKWIMEALGSTFEYADQVAKKLIKSNDDLTAAQKKAKDERVANLQSEFKAIDKINQDSTARISAIATEIANLNDKTISDHSTTTLFGAAKDAINEFKQALGGLPGVFGKFPEDLSKAVVQTQSFSQLFKDLPGILQPTLASFKAQSAAVKTLSEEVIKTNKALQDGLKVLGLTGVVLTERQNIFAGEEKYREQTKLLIVDEKEQQQVLNGIINQRALLEDKINGLSKDDLAIVNLATQQAREDQARREKLAELQQQELLTNVKIDAAKKAHDEIEVAALTVKLSKIKELIEAQRDEISLLGVSADEQLAGRSADDARKLTDMVRDRVVLAGREVVVNNQLKQIAKDKLEIERLITQQVNDKNNLLLRQQTLDLRNANALAQIKADNDRSNFDTRFSLPEVTSLVSLQGALTLLKAQVDQAQKLRQLAIDQQNILIEQNKLETSKLITAQALATTEKERNAIGAAIAASISAGNAAVQYRNTLEQANNVKIKEETLLLEKAAEDAQHARNIIEKPLSTGFFDGVRKAAQQLPSLYQGTVDVIKNIVTGLTDFIATSIVDAFDPTKKEDIVQRFAQFLQAIAKQVIEMFLHLAFVKLVLGLGFLGDGGVPGGGLPTGLGFANGGPIVGPAPGFADGGMIRPTNLDARDTIPIWAQRGEFVQPVSAVMKYGADVMDRIRNGLIDPSSLRSLAGMNSTDRLRPNPRANLIVSEIGRQITSTPSSQSPMQQNNGPVQAVVVASDQHLDRLLAGGKTAFFNFAQKHRNQLRGILNS